MFLAIAFEGSKCFCVGPIVNEMIPDTYVISDESIPDLGPNDFLVGTMTRRGFKRYYKAELKPEHPVLSNCTVCDMFDIVKSGEDTKEVKVVVLYLMALIRTVVHDVKNRREVSFSEIQYSFKQWEEVEHLLESLFAPLQ